MARLGSKIKMTVWSMQGEQARRRTDQVATEEPLEIRLLAGEQQRTVAVTMRTPGADFELAAGFLFGEGILSSREEIGQMAYCVEPESPQEYNIVNVYLRRETLPDLMGLERHFFTSSACGVCGKAGLETLHLRHCHLLPRGQEVTAAILRSLPSRLQAAQQLFAATGGIHAAALFSLAGELLALREDVGRHNAVDKLVGWALTERRLPLSDCIVLVSGRSSFEIVQKCLVAGVPILCAVSAPSSLAVQVAQEFDMTLVGFLRDDRFNVYAGWERVAAP